MENAKLTTMNQNTVSVDFQCLPKLNYAMHQNGVKLIRVFVIENTSDTDLHDIDVKITSADPFIKEVSSHIVDFPKGQKVDLTTIEVELNPNFIIQLTERLETSLKLTVSSAESLLCECEVPVSVLSFNEWPGAMICPNLLASFVTPNSPSIAVLLNRAAFILKDWTGESALNGYQTKDADRAKKMAAAIFEAIRELKVVYCEPPASFENSGQRIRLADEVVKTKLATCIDCAALYASCLEAVGLYPLLVLTKGHAFAGVWLVSDTLPDSVYDEPSLLSKHIGLHDIVLVETTCFTEGNEGDFDRVCELGTRHLDKADEFVCVVDVARCRFTGVRPLPTRVLEGDKWVVDAKSLEEVKHIEPAKIDRYEIQTEIEQVTTKQNIWERKLLDLSLRNSLLNYKVTQKSLIILSSAVDKLEDAVFAGGDYQILPRLVELESKEHNEDWFSYGFSETSDLGKHLLQQLQNKRLYSVLGDRENTEALKGVYRASKLSIEENGANSLYLTLGMLRWTEPNVEKAHYAPILLVPMEIVRRGAGYVVRARDEETLLNVTLVEMLRQNYQIQINGLNPLPEDKSGIDVNKVFAVFRNAIIQQKGWDIIEMAVLGNFSFSKFIMWNDIHSNLEALQQNKIVDSLIQGKLMLNVEGEDAGARQIDHELAPNELALPVGADSSQLEAVFAATAGKSFILHGPPGTGKSQTITNIIANALFQGKRVLFAAEKMAALSVVQNRLAKIGLAPFCLEVHSNKAKKSDVLAQLQAASEVTKVKSPAAFESEANKLMNLRQQLNAYVEDLHKPSYCGISLYEAVTRYCLLSETSEKADFAFPADMVPTLSAGKLDEWLDAIEQLSIVTDSCGHPASHPLRLLNFQQYSPDLHQKLEQDCTQAVDLMEQAKDIASKLDFNADSAEKFHALQLLATHIAQLPTLTADLVRQTDVMSTIVPVINMLEHGKKAQSIREELLSRYGTGIFAHNVEVLKAKWDDAEQKWFLGKWIGQRGVRKEFEKCAKGKVSLPADLDLLITWQKEQSAFESQQNYLSLFGTHSRSSVADFDEMIAMENGMVGIQRALNVLADDMNQMVEFKKKLANQLADGFSSFKNFDGAIYAQLAEVSSKLNVVDAELLSVVELDKNAVLDTSLPYSEGRINTLTTIKENLSKLKDRFNYLLERQKLQDAKLGFFVQYIEQHEDAAVDGWKKLFECSFYKALAQYLFSLDQNMTLFKGDIFEANIKRFRDMNAQYQELVKAELYARLAAKLPDFTVEAASSSEVGVLQKNIHNKGRGTSLRNLFDSIPNMLSRLAPCMLMSPMSIAQYLDVKKQPKFDLVIFDEASQMPTSEAVGAIARGENVIVVGDPKQMPPTSFFNTNTVDEEMPEVNDLESILDDCLALSIPSKYLRFHYRSKHESLIAFSNSQYYGSKLCTFPSPDNRVSKVTFEKVDGHYDKGKSRQNKAEAQAVVDEVVRRLKDEELRKRSIGIVTFSSVQQTLIEDLLVDVFAKNSELDELATQCAEPLFVKNLENVQGDERDVILFSVGYGPDANGSVSMNFGPLNQVGGERRLNVAVSRARYEMKVFSTLTADMIDLNRTNAEGVRGLKEFLAFAQRGTRVLTEGDMETIKGTETIATVIASELNKLGYETDIQVGCSSFRIDVAVVDPADKGRYLLGIVCDGDSYFSAETARDREVCQPDILRGLGWNIAKVWTVDWWEDKEAVLKKLQKKIEDIKKGKSNGSYKEPAKPVAVKLEEAPVSRDENKAGGVTKMAYDLVSLPTQAGGMEAMMAPASAKIIKSQMKEVIAHEAPVTANYLLHRVLAAWDVPRMTPKAEAYLRDLLEKGNYQVTNNGRQSVVWGANADISAFSFFRTSTNRESGDIPVEEYACAMRFVLAQQVAIKEEDLKKLTSSQLGFARMGGNLDDLLTHTLSLLQTLNVVSIEDGKVKLA